MSAPPYMKLYWGDYHKATRHLTTAQHGAYLLLISEAWRLGGVLPADDALLARWALCSQSEWSAMRPVVMGFFALRRGKYHHDRVREELASYESTSRKRKEAGKRGGLASPGKHTEITEAIAIQLPTQPEPEPEPEPEKKKKGANAPSARATRRCPPDFVPSKDILDVGKNAGLSDSEIAGELAQFRDCEFRTSHSDWDATCRNWLRKAGKDRSRFQSRTTEADPRRANTESRRGAWVEYADERDRSAPSDEFDFGGGGTGQGGLPGHLRIAHSRDRA